MCCMALLRMWARKRCTWWRRRSAQEISRSARVAFGKDIIWTRPSISVISTALSKDWKESSQGLKLKLFKNMKSFRKMSFCQKILNHFLDQWKFTKLFGRRLLPTAWQCVRYHVLSLYVSIRCCHGEHLGFYELPTETN